MNKRDIFDNHGTFEKRSLSRPRVVHYVSLTLKSLIFEIMYFKKCHANTEKKNSNKQKLNMNFEIQIS